MIKKMVPQENVTLQEIKVVQEQKYKKMILYKTLNFHSYLTLSCINYFSMDLKMYFSLHLKQI